MVVISAGALLTHSQSRHREEQCDHGPQVECPENFGPGDLSVVY